MELGSIREEWRDKQDFAILAINKASHEASGKTLIGGGYELF